MWNFIRLGEFTCSLENEWDLSGPGEQGRGRELRGGPSPSEMELSQHAVPGDTPLLRHLAWHCLNTPDQPCLKALCLGMLPYSAAWVLVVAPRGPTEIFDFASTELLMPSFPVMACGKGEEIRGRPDSGTGRM